MQNVDHKLNSLTVTDSWSGGEVTLLILCLPEMMLSFIRLVVFVVFVSLPREPTVKVNRLELLWPLLSFEDSTFLSLVFGFSLLRIVSIKR